MNEYEDFYDDDLMEFMIESGYIEISGFDKDGDLVYRMTPKMLEEFPDIFEEHISFTNEIVFSTWQKGFIEVSITEEGSWTIVENEKTRNFMDYQDQLTKEEWLLMAEINNMIDNGTI